MQIVLIIIWSALINETTYVIVLSLINPCTKIKLKIWQCFIIIQPVALLELLVVSPQKTLTAVPSYELRSKRLSICKNWEPYLIQISPLWGHLSVCHGTASSRAAIFRPLHGSLILTTYMSASVISPRIKTLMLRIVTGDESWISGFHPETKQLFLQEEVCSVQ